MDVNKRLRRIAANLHNTVIFTKAEQDKIIGIFEDIVAYVTPHPMTRLQCMACNETALQNSNYCLQHHPAAKIRQWPKVWADAPLKPAGRITVVPCAHQWFELHDRNNLGIKKFVTVWCPTCDTEKVHAIR